MTLDEILAEAAATTDDELIRVWLEKMIADKGEAEDTVTNQMFR